MWVYMLKEKGETLYAFKKFKRLVKNKSNHKLKKRAHRPMWQVLIVELLKVL